MTDVQTILAAIGIAFLVGLSLGSIFGAKGKILLLFRRF